MRLLHFSDLTVDAPPVAAAASASGEASANAEASADAEAGRGEVREAFRRICELAKELNVDALCCAGNLYDEASVTEETAEFLREGFAAIHPLPVLVAPGSTDWHHPESYYGRSGYWSSNVHIFTEPSLVPVELEGVTIWGAAHTMPYHERGFLDEFAVAGDGPHLALFHGCEASLAEHAPTAPFTAGQIGRAGLDHALVGHVPQAHAATDYTYPGRAAPRRDAARTSGGAVLVTIDQNGSILRQWHDALPPAAAPTPVAASAAVAESVAESVAPAGPVGWSGPAAPAVSDGPAAPVAFSAPAWLAEIFDPDPDDRPDLDEIARQRTVRGEFVRHVRKADLGEDEGPILRAGLLALDGALGGGG